MKNNNIQFKFVEDDKFNKKYHIRRVKNGNLLQIGLNVNKENFNISDIDTLSLSITKSNKRKNLIFAKDFIIKDLEINEDESFYNILIPIFVVKIGRLEYLKSFQKSLAEKGVNLDEMNYIEVGIGNYEIDISLHKTNIENNSNDESQNHQDVDDDDNNTTLIKNNQEFFYGKFISKIKFYDYKKTLFLILLILLLLFIRSCKNSEGLTIKDESIKPVDTDDSQLIDGEIQQNSLQEELNNATNYFRLRISSSIVFDNSTALGEFRIQNSNNYKVQVIVNSYDKETKSVDENVIYYISPLMSPNQSIKEDKLDVILESGKYNCVAFFYIYSVDDESYIGKVGQEILLTIK